MPETAVRTDETAAPVAPETAARTEPSRESSRPVYTEFERLVMRERDELLARRELGDQVDKALDDVDRRIEQVRDKASATRGLGELFRGAASRWARARITELEEQRRETRQAAQVLRDEAARLLREAQAAAGMARAREDSLHPLAAKIRRLTIESWQEAEREIARAARRG